MYIIVCGAGTIGTEVTKLLVAHRHNVVVIDKDSLACQVVHSETGAPAIVGNVTDLTVLEKAGARNADIVLCLARLDSDNITSALLAKSLGVPRIIARLYNPHYEESYRLAGVSLLVRVADLLINQIMIEIEQPKVRNIMTLGKGKADVFAIKIPAKAKSIGIKIREITQHKKFPDECVFMGVYKEEIDEFVIPRGEYELAAGDTVFLITKKEFIEHAADFLTQEKFSLWPKKDM
ncbi:MAG: TrkA family potassium uptake protein [Spirochaetales bacterium]|nr:TrkA family potassium uptake protein [Spirochaetales bacterium]